jgi:hypothetical protein
MVAKTLRPHHVQIDNLNAQFIAGGSNAPLMLVVRGFSARITRDGLGELVSALIPDQPLRLYIVDHRNEAGCTLQLQATRAGFTPRITISLSASKTLAGGILINVDPANRWSPLDRVMLGIAHHSLDKIAAKEPDI